MLSEVAQTVDHFVIVSNGRLRFDGSLAELGDEALEHAFLRLTAENAADTAVPRADARERLGAARMKR